MARDNILRKTNTPQLKNLFDAWWRSTDDQASDRQDQVSDENTGTGEVGTGKSAA
jgi:hypothetical protein